MLRLRRTSAATGESWNDSAMFEGLRFNLFDLHPVFLGATPARGDWGRRFQRFLCWQGRRRTPGPPPFSSMNSTPRSFQGAANGHIIGRCHRDLEFRGFEP
jgi:hypothetical protein